MIIIIVKIIIIIISVVWDDDEVHLVNGVVPLADHSSWHNQMIMMMLMMIEILLVIIIFWFSLRAFRACWFWWINDDDDDDKIEWKMLSVQRVCRGERNFLWFGYMVKAICGASNTNTHTHTKIYTHKTLAENHRDNVQKHPTDLMLLLVLAGWLASTGRRCQPARFSAAATAAVCGR